MIRFLPHRISLKLALSFGVIVLLLCRLAFYASGRMDDLSRESEWLVKQDLNRLLMVQEVHVTAEGTAKELLVLLTAERNQRESAYAKIDGDFEHLDHLLRDLHEQLTGPAIAQQLMVVQRCREDYKRVYFETAELFESDREAAAREFSNQTQRSLDDFVAATALLAHMQHDAMVARQAASAVQIETDRRNVIIAALLTALASGFVAWRVTLSIVRPLAETEAVAHKISRGDYSQRLPEEKQSEIGRVGIAMNRMSSEIAEREQTIVHLAYHDTLTNCANRAELLRVGGPWLVKSPDSGPYIALVYIDLKRLKVINEALGFAVGDACLIETAHRLHALLPTNAILARLSGGSFAALLAVADKASVDALVLRILDSGREPAQIGAPNLDLALVMGAAAWPDHGIDIPTLLRNAEIALYETKRSQETFAWYNNEFEAIRLSQLSLLSELHQAVANNDLRLYVQPKQDLLTGKIKSAEALVRWQHPRRGFISPAEFIPFAEQTGDISQITRWMLTQTLALIARLKHAGLPISIAVNAATRDIQDPGFPAMLAALIQKSGAPPNLLRIEITESGLMRDAGQALGVMHELRTMGIELSIDDFGTGYSSLAYLQKLPVSELKIDRSFVVDVDKLPDARRLLESIVQLGLNMSLSVTAEGVETSGELGVLHRLGCHTVQGYLIAKPMPEDNLAQWLTDYAAAHDGIAG